MGKKPVPNPALEFAGGFMEPLSAAIQAQAQVAVAQAQANAEIIQAQQKTQQAAIQANQFILHELDRDFFHIEGKLGRGKNAPRYKIDGSVLDMFALGAIGEGLLWDYGEYRDGNQPRWFNAEWDDVRTPRTQIAGLSTRGGFTEEGELVTDTAGTKAAGKKQMTGQEIIQKLKQSLPGGGFGLI
jgi:hypothetical protein